MSNKQSESAAETRDLDGFERNRFFHGKLMTARDMLADQNYHRDRLETLTRLVTGAGVVTGLDVAVSETDGGDVEVTVEPGVAHDEAGQQIVVDDRTTTVLGSPGGDEIDIYLEFDEASRDPVPVPGSEGVYRDESTYNRIVETFEVTYTETDDPEPAKTVAPVEFPSRDDVDEGPLDPDDPALADIAASYLEGADSGHGDHGRSRVFLGSFERDSDGWRRIERGDARRKPHVYTNDMLYAAIARHVTDFDNPHEVSAKQASEETFDELRSELADLRDTVEALESREPDQRGLSLERFLLEKKVGAFEVVAGRFNDETATEVAEQIIEETQTAIEEERFEPEQYREFTEQVAERERELADVLQDQPEGGVTAENLRSYESALDELEDALADEDNDYQVAVAQDHACEAARQLTDVVRI